MTSKRKRDDKTDNLAMDDNLGKEFMKELCEFQEETQTHASDDDESYERYIRFFDLCARGLPHREGLADLFRRPLETGQECTIPRPCVQHFFRSP